MGRALPQTIELHFEVRDNVLRITCDDVPGFYLCGMDVNAVLADIEPMIKHLLKANRGVDVDLLPMSNDLQPTGVSSMAAVLSEPLDGRRQRYRLERAA